MVRNPIIRKYIVVGIIFLFIGVVVTPSINVTVVNASDDNDLVEVTTQAFGIKGFDNTTVKLTRQGYQNLEQYLVDFRTRLNQTTTRAEAVLLFKEAVLELDKYRLLPKAMSVEQAQRLATEMSRNYLVSDLYKNREYEPQMKNNSNFFCLIAGETAMNTRLFSVIEMGCSVFCWFLFVLSFFAHQINDDTVVINKTISFLKSVRNTYDTINSKRIIGTGIITLGHSHPAQIPPPYRYDPAVGWIMTQGLLGKKSWNGSFFGNIFPVFPFDSDSYTFNIGALGFVGIKLNKGNGGLFFLGSAFQVKIVYS